MTLLSEWLSNFSLSVRANTAAFGVVPIEVFFGAVAGSKTGHAVWGGTGGSAWGLYWIVVGPELDRRHGMASSDWSLAD